MDKRALSKEQFLEQLGALLLRSPIRFVFIYSPEPGNNCIDTNIATDDGLDVDGVCSVLDDTRDNLKNRHPKITIVVGH